MLVDLVEVLWGLFHKRVVVYVQMVVQWLEQWDGQIVYQYVGLVFVREVFLEFVGV